LQRQRIAAMASLTAGVQYSLSSNQNNGLMPKQRTSKNKTLFFVKLTDSCLKAVEDYLKCCQQVSKTPFWWTYNSFLFSRFLIRFLMGFRNLFVVYVISLSFLQVAWQLIFFLWPRPQSRDIFRFDQNIYVLNI